MSKFDNCSFFSGDDEFAVSKEKYTKEQAIELAKIELESVHKPYYIAVSEAFVRHRAGINENNEPCVGCWLEYEEHKRSCPVWAFHKTRIKNEDFKEYEYVEVAV